MTDSSEQTRTLIVISTNGGIYNVKVQTDMTIQELKLMAVNYFRVKNKQIDDDEEGKIFNLISVSRRNALIEGSTISQLDLKDNGTDELMLIEHCPPTSKEKQLDLRGPTIEEIKEATKDLEERSWPKVNPPVEENPYDDVRNILISLVEAGSRLLAANPDGMETFNLIQERLGSMGQLSANSPLVKQLMEMGFSEKSSIKALKLKKNSLMQALSWLIEQNTDIEEEAAGTSEPQPDKPPKSGSSKCDASPQAVIDAFRGLLDSFRENERLNFEVNQSYFEHLTEMGFPEDKVKEALRVTRNNIDTACSWLQGEHKGSLHDLDQGLNPDGPIYKAVMANHIIQLNLTKPKTLLAFLSILENSKSADLWRNDPDIGPILMQIFRIYHTEKHSKDVNHEGPSSLITDFPGTSLSTQLQSAYQSNFNIISYNNNFGEEPEEEEDYEDDLEDEDVAEYILTSNFYLDSE